MKCILHIIVHGICFYVQQISSKKCFITSTTDWPLMLLCSSLLNFSLNHHDRRDPVHDFNLKPLGRHSGEVVGGLRELPDLQHDLVQLVFGHECQCGDGEDAQLGIDGTYNDLLNQCLRITWPLNCILHKAYLQCGHIGWFFKALGDKFSYKSSPSNIGAFGRFWKTQLFKWKVSSNFLGIFFKKMATIYFNIWSHCLTVDGNITWMLTF